MKNNYKLNVIKFPKILEKPESESFSSHNNYAKSLPRLRMNESNSNEVSINNKSLQIDEKRNKIVRMSNLLKYTGNDSSEFLSESNNTNKEFCINIKLKNSESVKNKSPLIHILINFKNSKSKYQYKISDMNRSTSVKIINNKYEIIPRSRVLNFDPFMNKQNFHLANRDKNNLLLKNGHSDSPSITLLTPQIGSPKFYVNKAFNRIKCIDKFEKGKGEENYEYFTKTFKRY